jgi:hypothetical protein
MNMIHGRCEIAAVSVSGLDAEAQPIGELRQPKIVSGSNAETT